jgi:cytoskeletal protein CcmA (bactofilin family)
VGSSFYFIPAPASEVTVDASSFGKSARIEGALSGAEDLFFDGELRGTIRLPQNRLTLGINSRVNAAVEAKHVVVAGALAGDIRGAESVEIRRTASFTGKLNCRRVSIEEGATVKSEIDMLGENVKSSQEARHAGPNEQLAISLS